MKKKIKEIQDYFKNKIIKGQFKVLSFGEYSTKIVINQDFIFSIWTANEAFGISTGTGSLMDLNFTEKEKAKIWKKIEKHIKKNHDEVVILEKRKQLEKLKAELGE